jgi:hypothetical protein
MKEKRRKILGKMKFCENCDELLFSVDSLFCNVTFLAMSVCGQSFAFSYFCPPIVVTLCLI